MKKVGGRKKVEDGKLVKVDLTIDEKINDVNLYGDFFLQPPSIREDLENKILGLNTDTDLKIILNNLEEVKGEIIGFSRTDLAQLVVETLNNSGDDK